MLKTFFAREGEPAEEYLFYRSTFSKRQFSYFRPETHVETFLVDQILKVVIIFLKQSYFFNYVKFMEG